MRVQSSEFRAGSEKNAAVARAPKLPWRRTGRSFGSSRTNNATEQNRATNNHTFTHIQAIAIGIPPWEFLFYKTGVKVVAAL